MKIDEDFIKKMVSNILPEKKDAFICNVNQRGYEKDKFSITLIFVEDINDSDREKIKNYINCLPNLKNIEILNISKKILTEISLLRIIKIYQPIKLEEIIKKIELDNLFYGESNVLKNMLDKLRKNNYIIRASENNYFVTEKALGIIPHGTFKKSSDIMRILAVNKKMC